MTKNVAYLLKGGIVFLAGLLIALAAGSFAFADESTMEALNMTAYELQQEIEARQATYAEARREVDAAAASVDEVRKRIEELERQIPEQQERSAKAAREQYKFQQQSAGLIDMLLGADDFYSFLTQFEYVTYISDANANEMARLTQLQKEIEAEHEELKAAQHDAEAKAEEASAAMEATQQAQAEVQRRIEEEARLQAEIAAQAAAAAENPRSNDSGESSENEGDSGNSGASENGDSGNANEEAAQPTSPGDDSVDGWAARIDAYLAGSPLAGQGKTFAKAALEYGVDPRLSPAISFTESSKGLYCFKPHNAWGWGSSSWSSWEEAIYAHVAGLARGYGGQLTEEGARKYCPPNWKAWYNRTKAQMELI